MSVYKFIRSKDVREHNEKIGHKFNILKSCFLVWRNPDITLNEKHELWRQICLTMPDMKIKKRLNLDYHPSLYELIEQFVKLEGLDLTFLFKVVIKNLEDINRIKWYYEKFN